MRNQKIQTGRLGMWCRFLRRAVILVPLLLFTVSASAQIRVDPAGVNVNTQNPTSAFLTFGNLNHQVPAEATWCGELIPAAPDIGQKCSPNSIFGVIPARYDRTTPSGTNAYSDVMTLPASVARRAYQAAVSGANSSFFFVRRFVSTIGGPDEFVVVICRTSGGMSGSPFSLTDVILGFEGIDRPIVFAREGEKLPQIKAELTYTGTGRLKGRWEVVMPGEDPPTAQDLLTEASLPYEQRRKQRKYTQLSRFNELLTPSGKYTLLGPETKDLPMRVAGEYLLLLRIEAAEDSGASSDLRVVGAGPAVVYSGAVAGFPMPVLRYFVGPGSAANGTISLLAPAENLQFGASDPIQFAWMDAEGIMIYRLEIATEAGTQVLSAVLPRGTGTYRAPPWLRERATVGNLKWRVVGLDSAGNEVGASAWRAMRLAPANQPKP